MVEKYKIFSGMFFTILWVMMTFPFVSQELLPFLAPAKPYLYILFDIIMIVMGCLTLRNRGDIIVVASFFVIAGLSSFYFNHDSLILVINGFRGYIGLIFALPVIRYFATGKNGERFMKTFDQSLLIFLWIQVPCIFWQFFKYGAGDRGGGSLGDLHSGEISTLIYVISFYLILKKWDASNYWRSLWKNRIYVFLLLPSFFNETKISFILLLLYFVLLMKVDRSMIRKTIIASPFLLVAFTGLGFVYLKVTNQEADVVMSYEFFEKYFIGEDLDHSLELALAVQDQMVDLDTWGGIFDMPRAAKIVFVPKILDESHKSQLFGAGIGQFKGFSVLHPTPFSLKYRWLLLGSKPWLFYVLVEMGIFGILWTIGTFLHDLAFRRNKFVYGMNIKLYIAAMMFVFLFYLDIFIDLNFCMIILYILFRTQVTASDEKVIETEEAPSSTATA